MSLGLAILLGALSGFVSLSYEILWYRMFGVATGGTAFTFGIVLGFYLYGLAGGGLIARALCRGPLGRSRFSGETILVLFVVAANLAAYAVLPLLGATCGVGACLAALPMVGVSAGLLGAVLPLACDQSIAPDRLVGARLSWVYGANILGSAAGGLVTGYILLDRWPAVRVAALLGVLGLGVAAVLVLFLRRRRWPALVVLAAVGVGIVRVTPVLLDQLYERLIFRENFHPGVRFAHTAETRAGVVSITPAGTVYGGGVYDGMVRVDLGHDGNHLVRAFAVAALHPQPRRVLMIGLSMGAWAQVLAHLPELERLTIVEINPGYLQLIQRYPLVAGLLTNPKVTIEIDDARRWLSRHPEPKFDLVVANLTFHWREHATNVLSVEFLELVRKHLAPGGVYYYNTTFSPDAVKTGLTVFRHGVRFMNFMAVGDEPVQFDTRRWAEVLRAYTIEGRHVLDPNAPADSVLLGQLVSLETAPDNPDGPDALELEESLRARVRRARIITDNNMASEWRVFSADAWTP